jgi:glyoxylase-like metal-dependent hydrolase (beta-lactamase superfamily II)
MVNRWVIVTVGNLSRNRYWGESEQRAIRQPVCTTTLLEIGALRLLVDPSIADAKTMASELDRRSGLALEEIDAVFVTHEHGDHHAGLACFPQADWFAAEQVAEAITRMGQYEKRLISAAGKLPKEVEVLPMPGHTLAHHGLRFEADGLSFVVAGDAVMTRDFWTERRGFFNSADLALASRTMDALAQIADAIIPGHDNWFLTGGNGGLGRRHVLG